MSQPPDAPDPYLPPQDGQPDRPQPYAQQPSAQPPSAQPPHPGHDWSGGHPDLGGRPSQQEVRADKPDSVVRLVQVMVAGAVLAVLSGVYGLLTVDSGTAEALAQVEQDLAEGGLDPDSFARIAGPAIVVAVVLTTVVVAGLWILFAWLFGRGSGRVLGTVLGAVNGIGSVSTLLMSVDLIDLVLQLVTLAVVVGAMVLLWLPSTSAWFRAVRAADRRTPWN